MLSEDDEAGLRRWAKEQRAKGMVRAGQVVELCLEIDRLRQRVASMAEELRAAEQRLLQLTGGTP